MRSGPRIPIYGVDERPAVSRAISQFASGEHRVRPLVEYQTRPLDFLTDVLRIPRRTLVWSENPGYDRHMWDGTPDPLLRACRVLGGEIVGKRHVAIEAGTGTQKTYTAAGFVLWFLGSFEDALVVTTGAKAEQLKVGLWKEVGVLLPAFRRRFPKVQAIDLKLRMRPEIADPFDASDSSLRQEKWSAVGWCAGVDAGVESAVRSQGFHAEHMLIIAEEMPGIDPAIITALRNTQTADHNVFLGLGNPDHQLDPLHKFAQLPGVEAIRISAFDHPNVVCRDSSIVPGATSQQFIDDKRIEFGENGPLFLSRVRGIAPTEAHNALIKLAWLEEAARKWEHAETNVAMSRGPVALGCDPAQTENGDRCALARWQGSVLDSIETLRTRDALEFGEEVWRIMQREGIRPEHVGVDSVGIGSNVVNYMRRVMPHGPSVHAIEGGAEDPIEGAMKAAVPSGTVGREYQPDANRFLNIRAQVYWQFAQDLQHGLIAVPRQSQLWRELMAITYSTEGGEVRLEKKKDLIKKLGRSPDYADAVVYGNWVRQRTTKAVRPQDVEKVPGRALPLAALWSDGRVRQRSKPSTMQEIFVANIDEANAEIFLTGDFGPASRRPFVQRVPRDWLDTPPDGW
jgi:hypothetical protein